MRSVFTLALVIQIIGIIALCILVWFVGPLLAVAGKVPLESELARMVTIFIILFFWAIYNLIKQQKAQRKEQNLMTELADPEREKENSAIEEARSKEMSDLRNKFEFALKTLKSTRSKGWRDHQFLYELPWYVIIGAPGCGKTTLLANSELHFPLEETLNRRDVRGVGGTRNCDWFFTEEAIFLDTAGRYTTQDSHQSVDSAAWRNFLGLIKKYRPRRPINGALVAVSISDLIQQSEEENRNQAALIRRRITELVDELGLNFPIYMIFTKCDLIAGFRDLFSPLNQEERSQVWGETFQELDAIKPHAAVEKFMQRYDELISCLNQWTFRRIQEERDIHRRSLILGFPSQMALVKPKLDRFLYHLFSTSRYEKKVPLLRGVYFTSATQEGTPIDRVLGILASTYGLDRRQVPVRSQKSKSYFINRLLKEVIFPEAQLAGVNPKLERRYRMLQVAAYGGVMMLAAGLIGLWSTNYVYNRNAMMNITKEIENFENTREVSNSWDAAVRTLRTRINIIKAANRAYPEEERWFEFGLNQKEKLEAGIERIHRGLLRHRFLPIVKARLEQRIHANLNAGSDSETALLYELLKVYLMLGEPRKHLDVEIAEQRINGDWENSFAREPDFHKDLSASTHALLNLTIDPIQLDKGLVKKARIRLNAQPLYAQIYAHIKSESMADTGKDIYLKEIFPQDWDKIFTTADGQSLESLMIPGFFTYEGYHGIFNKKGLEYTKQVLKENWVTENYAADQESDLSRLFSDVQKMYFEEYQRQWAGLLHNLNLKKPKGISQEIMILEMLAGLETPLRPLLEVIDKNTTLSRIPKPQASEKQMAGAKALASMAGHDLEAGEEVQALADLAEEEAQQSNTSPYVYDLEEEFEDINYLIRSREEEPPPVEQVIAGLGDVRDYMIQVDEAAAGDEQALAIAIERIQGSGAGESVKAAQKEFARQPEPFKTWFSMLTSRSLTFTLDNAMSELNANWKNNILAFYKQSLEGRYPLEKHSAYDIAFEDFSEFFKPGGRLDTFFNQHLKPFVDASQTPWRPRRIENHAMNLSPETLRRLQHAAVIRDAFFAGGGDTPAARFELRPVDLDETIAAFRIDIEGQTAEYSHGPTRSDKFVWPGPAADTGVRITVKTIEGEEITHLEEGPWAWLKILDHAVGSGRKVSDWFMLTFRLGSYQAEYELRATSAYHPFQLSELQNFRCPESF